MKRDKPKKLNGFFSQSLILCLAILFFVVGCGHSDEYAKFHEMCKDIPKKYNSADIRKAVLPLFVEYKRHPLLADGSGILNSDVPKEIKTLPLFSDAHWIDTTWVGNTNEGLMFVAGGGFGHWGIIVYQNKNHRDGNGPSYETVPWTNGIFFIVNLDKMAISVAKAYMCFTCPFPEPIPLAAIHGRLPYAKTRRGFVNQS